MNCDTARSFRVNTLMACCGVSRRTVLRWRSGEYVPGAYHVEILRGLCEFRATLEDNGLDKDLQVIEHFGAKLPVGIQGSKVQIDNPPIVPTV